MDQAAKKAETRGKRVRETAELASKNVRTNQVPSVKHVSYP